ncbi:hypothetical protein [Empedobacter sp. 189-2]|uniref:hypothetical protein n=1 Tax=Empedobacter sp. 189-2 TaxID=2746724 RepID=UPI00257859CF|nr:hypothetical protein [Empedobacter sp. 189-2]MDM1543911.1 hypothetical protein [Empedobacter sp. 189-2]
MMDFKITQKEINERISLFKSLKNAPIKIPKKLFKPHIIMENSKYWFLEENRVLWNKKMIHLDYSGDKIYLQRVLLMIDFLVRFLEFRGHSFKLDRNGYTYCDIKGIEIHFNFRQKTKRILDENSINSTYKFYKSENTRIMVFQMYENSYDRKDWFDTPKTKLEEKLLHIIAYTEIYCENKVEENKKRDERHRLYEIEQEKLKEIQRLKQLQVEKINKLFESSEKYNQADNVIKYLDDRKKYLLKNNLFTQEEIEYNDWGMTIVDDLIEKLFKDATKNQ